MGSGRKVRVVVLIVAVVSDWRIAVFSNVYIFKERRGLEVWRDQKRRENTLPRGGLWGLRFDLCTPIQGGLRGLLKGGKAEKDVFKEEGWYEKWLD